MKAVSDDVSPPEVLHTLVQTAHILNISTKTLLEHVRLGNIRSAIVGLGKKRKHRRFSDQNIATFISKMKVREVPECQYLSVKHPHSINTISKSTVIAFSALQKQKADAKPKP